MYTCSWFSKFLVDGAKSPGDMARRLREEAVALERMHRAGITLQKEVDDGWADFVTEDAHLAREFEFDYERTMMAKSA